MPRFNELFIFKAEGDSSAQRETREGELARTTFVPAADANSAAAAVSKAVGDRVPVGAVLFGFESMAGVAAYQERFAQAMTQ